MSQYIPKTEGNEKLVANKLGVATQEIYVTTRIRLLNKNTLATLSKFFMIESKNKPREKVTTKDCMLRQRLKTVSQQKFICRDRATNLGQNFRDQQCNY